MTTDLLPINGNHGTIYVRVSDGCVVADKAVDGWGRRGVDAEYACYIGATMDFAEYDRFWQQYDPSECAALAHGFDILDCCFTMPDGTVEPAVDEWRRNVAPDIYGELGQINSKRVR